MGASKIKSGKDLAARNIDFIQSYGKDLQMDIASSMDGVIANVPCVEFGDMGKELNDLSANANKLIDLRANGIAKKWYAPKLSVKKWLGKYETLESKIVHINEYIDTEVQRVNSALDAVLKSKDILEEKIALLHDMCIPLEEIMELDDSGDIKDLDLKKQMAASRLKALRTLETTGKQSIVESKMVYSNGLEAVSQLEQVQTDLVPIIKTNMMNVLANKVNLEAVKLRDEITKFGNKIVVDTAKNISETTKELLKNRESGVISDESVFRANEILQDTIKLAVESAERETSSNIEIVTRLKEANKQLTELNKTSYFIEGKKGNGKK